MNIILFLFSTNLIFYKIVLTSSKYVDLLKLFKKKKIASVVVEPNVVVKNIYKP